MTTLTVRASAAEPRTRGPRGLVWVMLRVHQSALLFWLMLVAVTAGALLWAYGPGADAAWAEYVAGGCDSARPGLGCDMYGTRFQRYDNIVGVSSGLLALVPLFTAAWAASALVGRELENGTAHLTWTQSVSPARWLAAKLAVPATLLTAGMLTLTLLHRLMWSAGTELHAAWAVRTWDSGTIFLTNGTTATAHALLGLALGALVGLLLPRALPALAGASVTTLAIAGALVELRPHLWPTVTLTSTDDVPSPAAVVREGALTSDGTRIPLPDCLGEPGCLTDHDITGFYADHHPTSHFWPLHLVETGIVLAAAALAVGAAFWLLRRRTGGAV
nr:ABC transporter permease [Streptomyces sp. SBE_14.2]